MRNIGKPSVQRGLTLIELLTVLTLTGILLTVAVPNMHQMLQLRRLDGAVQTYLSQLHWARQQAVALNQPIHLTFAQTASGSCYLFYVGERDRCQCDASSQQCTATAHALLASHLPLTQGVSVVTGSKKAITMDSLRGTVTPTFTAVFTNRSGASVNASTSVMGRTRTCSAAPGTLGLPACT